MITGVVLAKDEEKNIPQCLESLRWCEKILVVDDNSTDNTVKIAKKLGVRVIPRHLAGDFGAQHTWALKQVDTPWVLFVDADEIITPELATEIQQAVKKIECKGFFIPRYDFMWGERLKYGDVKDIKVLRLARRGAGQWLGKVHERWDIEGRVCTLKNPLLHYPHQNMVEFLQHINKYSTLRAQELYAQKQKTSVLAIIFYPVFKFLNLYGLKWGFLDGTRGFVHAMTMAFYSFLVRGKVYLLFKDIPRKSWSELS